MAADAAELSRGVDQENDVNPWLMKRGAEHLCQRQQGNIGDAGAERGQQHG